MEQALARRRRHGTTLSLVMLGLDDLKSINAGRGHQVCDRAIKTVGDVLGDTVRAGDWSTGSEATSSPLCCRRLRRGRP